MDAVRCRRRGGSCMSLACLPPFGSAGARECIAVGARGRRLHGERAQ